MPFEAFSRVKLPLRSVIAPFDVPFSMTVAPIMGSPFSSTIWPFTVLDCRITCTSFTVAKTACGQPA